MKNKSVSTRIKQIYVFSICGSILAITITYIISKRLSDIIVKPVESTIQKQKQFISDASHELKTPLAVIEANVDVLESQTGESKWMKYIQSEITSMNKLINDLLFLAKIENMSELKIKEMFDFSEEVNMTISMFESMAYEKQINIKYYVEENIKLNGNKEDIKQVLSVLLDNAIMHTKPNGQIIVKAVKEKNNILLQVKNEGDPIPDEEKEKIFERFYRVDKSRNRKEKRYGLGLAIAKSIVEQYKGKIDVNCKDGITTFSITLQSL
jgi:signal transduction histidine kinase